MALMIDDVMEFAGMEQLAGRKNKQKLYTCVFEFADKDQMVWRENK